MNATTKSNADIAAMLRKEWLKRRVEFGFFGARVRGIMVAIKQGPAINCGYGRIIFADEPDGHVYLDILRDDGVRLCYSWLKLKNPILLPDPLTQPLIVRRIRALI